MNTKPDPRRPWKAVAAAASAGLTALLAAGDVIPAPVAIGAAVVLAMIATYLTPNPRVPE